MEGQIKATRTEEAILKEIESIINGVSKNSFLQFLGTYEEEAIKKEQLFFEDFLLDQIPEQLFNSLVEIDPENFFKIQEILQKKANCYYAKATAEQITQYKQLVFWQLSKPSELRKHISKGIKNILLPRDKPSKYIWNNIAAKNNGAIEVITGNNKGKEGSVLVDISFDDVEACYSKELTETDRQVYNVVASIYENSGSDVITVNDICKLISSDKPAQSQLQLIINSLAKMQHTRLTISNKAEVKAGFNYPGFEYGIEYNSYLLPSEILTTKVNGIEATYIHLFREPPIYTFAKQRKQVTMIPGNIYKVPIRKTEDNRRIINYIIDHVKAMERNEELSRKLTFKKLCEKFNIPEDRKYRMKRKRFQETIIKVLEYFRSINYIQGYNIDQNKDITFILNKCLERNGAATDGKNM